jgi:hypothetical protein
MRILITLSQLMLGGTETYSVTVAEQLERLGHPTRLHAGRTSQAGRELVASRGLSLEVGDPLALAGREEFDAVVAQDAGSAYALSRRADLPQVFVGHGVASFEHPPRALHPQPPIVVLNERMRERAAALASRPEVVRLRQPIDLERFRPRTPSSPRPRRVLAFSNYLGADRLALLEGVCADLGLELARVGVQGEPSLAPQEAIAGADIVVGYGRSVLEALAMGRAAYVWDRGGGDGWVTPETYATLEADGFSGAATDAVVDAARLRADFAAYRPELGTLGFDLVRQHHSAAKHAEALVRVLERAEAPAPHGTADSLALLVRAEARAASRAGQLEFQLGLRVGEIEALREALDSERGTRVAAEAELEMLRGSGSWRLTAPLRRAARAVRSRLRPSSRADG